MNTRYQKVIFAICSIAFITLILDTKTTIYAAIDGINLCLRSIVPSLFPFILLSSVITTYLSASSFPVLSFICKPLGIPNGAELLFLLGLLSGYPVGAQNINNAFKNKRLSHQTAQRMLGFCSNAGPSFIFGMLGPMFESNVAPWCLWGIHIASAVLVGMIIPNKERSTLQLADTKDISFNQSMNIAIRAIATICGWVITFRILLTFLQRAVLDHLLPEISITISGLLELSNGCLLLDQLSSEGLRFILASLFLGIGGLCVAMQTASVTTDVGLGMYFPGKALQTSISICISSLAQVVLFSSDQTYPYWTFFFFLSLFLTIIFSLHIKLKNKCSILKKTVV